jgi:hypothetical protein
MTWKDLIEEFDQKFGPASPNPVEIRHDYIPIGSGIYEFLKERLCTKDVAQKFADAHFTAELRFWKRTLFLNVEMTKDHPLWDQTIAYSKNRSEESVLTVMRKKLQNGSWGCRLIREGDPADLEKEADLFDQCWCIGQLERAFVQNYEKVKTIDAALKKLTPEELLKLNDALSILLKPEYGRLDLSLSPLSNTWFPEKNLIIDETRKRLLDNLQKFEANQIHS